MGNYVLFRSYKGGKAETKPTGCPPGHGEEFIRDLSAQDHRKSLLGSPVEAAGIGLGAVQNGVACKGQWVSHFPCSIHPHAC